MPQYAWADAPPEVRDQVERFGRDVQEILAENRVGVYLHGSLAMGCFNPVRSDIDLLVVTERGMTAQIKRDVAQSLLRLSNAPCPIEVSFFTRAQLSPWEYPTPFDLHYSEDWRASYENELAGGTWNEADDTQNLDPDLAAHITVLRHRGTCLQGPPVAAVFPEVPREDYSASILADAAWARERMAENPVYGILNPCRVLHYLREGRGICSKDEAGVWAIETLPAAFGDTIRWALAVYRGDAEGPPPPGETLHPFAEYVAGQIRVSAPQGGASPDLGYVVRSR